jgi:drug/metabolite transporter (DMT)-like permease
MPVRERSNETWAVIAVVVTVAMWGLSSVLIKLASTTGIVTALYRLWIAMPLLWLTAAAPRTRRALGRDWLVASLVGGTLFATHQTLYFTALKLTTITNVSIIGALQPLLVLAVAGAMFDEHATRAAIAWTALALAGTVLVVLGSAGTPAWSPAGDLLAALNLFAFTGYFLASKRFRARVEPWPYVIGMTTVAGIVMLGVALATGQDLGSPHGWDWLVIATIAVFPGTLGHVLTNWAHAHASAFVISTLFLGVPVVAAAAAALVLGEPVTVPQVVGAALVLVAIARIVGERGVDTETLAQTTAEVDAP